MATPTTPNTTWVDGSGGGTPISAARLNVAETRIAEALAGFQYTYNAFTSTVSPTATTEATANTVVTASAITFNGTDVVMIEFYSPLVRPAATVNATISIYLYDGTSQGIMGLMLAPATNDFIAPMHIARILTPTAAAHTYSIRASVSTGTGFIGAGAGGVGNYMPGWIRITKVA